VLLSPSLAPAIPAVLSRVKHAMDLACDPAMVAAALGPLGAARPGLRVPGTFDGFELAVRAVVGQQISVRAARTVLGRIARAFGETLQADAGDAINRLFPSAARIAGLAQGDLTAVGMTGARARTVIAVAVAVAGGRIRLEPESDVASTVEALTALPGIGA
jgi:AraC family transcriptional regulator of adaptative response / DNA-3-methyladenine glycosylase II